MRSLEQLGRVYPPLSAEHPLVQDKDRCWICDRLFLAGQRTMLVASAYPEKTAVVAFPVHATCVLRGRAFWIASKQIPIVVERIKDGNGSSYPVLAVDGSQYTLEELGWEE